MAQGQQLLLPIYLKQKARAGDCHHPRGPGTEDTWKSSGVGDNDTRCASVTLPFLWLPLGVQAHPTSILLTPVRFCSLHSPAGTLSLSPHSAFLSPILLPACTSFPAQAPHCRRGAATSLLCSKRFKGSADTSIKGSKQRENIFSPQLNFIPVTKNPKELETSLSSLCMSTARGSSPPSAATGLIHISAPSLLFCWRILSSLNSCLPRKAGGSLSCCDNTWEQVLLCGVTRFDEFLCAWGKGLSR